MVEMITFEEADLQEFNFEGSVLEVLAVTIREAKILKNFYDPYMN